MAVKLNFEKQCTYPSPDLPEILKKYMHFERANQSIIKESLNITNDVHL